VRVQQMPNWTIRATCAS